MDDTNEKVGWNSTNVLGARIRQLRQAGSEKLTQEELAHRAGVSVSFLSMIERGERTPHIETLVRIAGALGVSMGELFMLAEDRQPEMLDPVLRPIAEFARSRSLTGHDIDRLLGVAKAMFQSTI